MALRRTLLITGGVIAAGGVGIWQTFIREGDFVLGAGRLVPPMLRARLGDQDRVFALIRRRETETTPAFSPRDGWRGERIELRAWDTATLEPVLTNGLVSMEAGLNADAGILGAEGATIWIHIGGIGAASAVDGRLLADQAGLVARNGTQGEAIPTVRDAFRFGNGLEFADRRGRGARLRIRGSDFGIEPVATQSIATQRNAIQRAAEWLPSGLPGLAEVRIDADWLGLLDANDTTAVPARARVGRAGPSRLWRGQFRTPEPEAVAPQASVPGKPPAAPLPRRPPQIAAAIERLTGAAALSIEEAPLHDATLLSEGRQVLRVTNPDGVLLAYRTAPGASFTLARIGLDGAVAWRARVPLDTLASLLPGERTLLLAGRRAGTAQAGPEAVLAVDLATGATRGRDLSTGEAFSA